jgi:mannose-1-phosphate guanylyltransferase
MIPIDERIGLKEPTMNILTNTWVIVLAGGDGTRLHALTMTESGVPVPKQFCSLRGGRSLLHEALDRARAIASPDHICIVVAEQHRRWWLPALADVADANIIVQPNNRGTANGILLPLLHIVARDPHARVALLPSDHHVQDELILAESLQRGVRELCGGCEGLLLLGISPDDSDPDLGYIVPGPARGDALYLVTRFVEKPDAASARALIEAGALWNAFIVMANAHTLVRLFARKFPQIVANMQKAVAQDSEFPGKPDATQALYRTLPDIDFSRHVLAGEGSGLSVLRVGHCGWSDIGTPQHLAQTLERLPSDAAASPVAGMLSLARQHARMTDRAVSR